MGEAKRKRATVKDLAQIDLARVAATMCQLLKITSPERGRDCNHYALYGACLLRRLGVAADLVTGYAAWRVGDNDGDVIAHHPSCCAPKANGAQPIHIWIEVAGWIIDFTTHDLVHKGGLVDAGDGGHTTVNWCPEFLLAEKHEVLRSLEQVSQVQPAGVFYYERIWSPPIEEWRPDDDTLNLLWFIYQNPDIEVLQISRVPQ